MYTTESGTDLVHGQKEHRSLYCIHEDDQRSSKNYIPEHDRERAMSLPGLASDLRETESKFVDVVKKLKQHGLNGVQANVRQEEFLEIKDNQTTSQVKVHNI